MRMSELRQSRLLVSLAVALGTPGMFVCAGELPETAKPEVEQVEVVVDEALVRKGKQVVARVPKGTTLKVLEREGRWYGVAVAVDGGEVKGWLHEKMVRPLPKSGGESAPAPEATTDSVPDARPDTEGAGEDEAAEHAPKAERFKLKCRNSGKLYGPFPFEDDAEVTIDRGAFALVRSESGQAATFHLKSRKTGKAYGPFECRYGSAVTLAARTFAIVRPETKGIESRQSTEPADQNAAHADDPALSPAKEKSAEPGKSLDALVADLKSQDENVREAAVAAMAQARNPLAVKPLFDFVGTEVRKESERKKRGHQTSTDPLAALFSDLEQKSTYESAVVALGKIGGTEGAVALDTILGVVGKGFEDTGSLGSASIKFVFLVGRAVKAGVDVVLPLCDSEDVNVRLAAVKDLGAICSVGGEGLSQTDLDDGKTRGKARLEELAGRDPDPRVRQIAAAMAKQIRLMKKDEKDDDN